MQSRTITKGKKRYNLVVPEELYSEVENLANRRHTTVVEMLRRFIRLGLIAAKVDETPGAALLIREGDKERQLLLF